MQFLIKQKPNKKLETIFDHILNTNLKKEEFPIEFEVNSLILNMTGGDSRKIEELDKRLGLSKMETGLEILYALKKEFRGNAYV